MFTKARLHLTLLYAALLAFTAILIAGGIGIQAVQEARRTDDRELQIRAAAIAAAIPQSLPPNVTNSRPPPPPGGGPDDHGGPPHLEQQGLLEYSLPVFNGTVSPQPGSSLPNLPDIPFAQQVVQSNTAGYKTITVQGNQVRLYSVPVTRSGQIVA